MTQRFALRTLVAASTSVLLHSCAATAPPSFDRDGVQASRAAALVELAEPVAGHLGERVNVESIEATPAARFRGTEFVLGEGWHANSYDVARADAIAQVARQLSSELTWSLEIASDQNGDDASVQISESIQETAAFNRTELIDVLHEASGCTATGCRVVAVLDRDRAAAELRRELDPAFLSWERDLSSIAPSSLPWDAAHAARMTQLAGQEIGLLIAEIEMVSGRREPAFDRWQANSGTMIEVLGQIVAAMPLHVDVNVATDSVADIGVMEGIREAAVRLGAHVSEGGECQSARLRTEWGSRCGASLVGVRCESFGTVLLEICDETGAELGSATLDGVVVAAHPSREELAIRAFQRAIPAADFISVVQESLCSAWPCRVRQPF